MKSSFHERCYFVVNIYGYWFFTAQLKMDSKEIITKIAFECGL